MNYIKKHQEGGSASRKVSEDDTPQLLSMDTHRSTLPVMKRSSIPMPKMPQRGQGHEVVLNYLTGQPIGVNDLLKGVAGTPVINPGSKQAMQDQGEIKSYVAPSLREKIKGVMNVIDRDGKSEVAKILTSPVNSAMNLLRPDKYFDGVQSDEEVGGALGSLAADVVNVAPIAVPAIRGVGNMWRGVTSRMTDRVANEALNRGNSWVNEWNSAPINQYRVAVNNQQIMGDTWSRINLSSEQIPIAKPVNVSIPTIQESRAMANEGGEAYDFGKPIKRGSAYTAGVYYPDDPHFGDLRGRAFARGGRSATEITSTTVHEGTHQYTNSNQGLSQQTQKLLRSPFGGNLGVAQSIENPPILPGVDISKAGERVGYITRPTEVHARLNELRSHYGIKPGEFVSEDRTNGMLSDVMGWKTPVDYGFARLVKDPKAFNDMFNKMFTPVVATGVGAAAATNYHSLMNPSPEQ